MAKLPTVDRIARDAPEGSRKVSLISPTINTGMADFGAGLVGLSVDLENVLKAEKEKHDQTRAEDAYNQLLQKRLDLTMGEDNGFMRKKGKDAIDPALMKSYQGQWNDAATQIEGTLGNPEQKELFKKLATVAGMQYQEDLMRHTFQESQTYNEGVFQSTLQVELDNINARWSDPNVVGQSVTRMEFAIKNRNLSPEEEKAAINEIHSKAHHAVISAALARGDVKYAKGWMDQYGEQIDPASIKAINTEMEQAKRADEETYLRTQSQNQAMAIQRKHPDDYAAQVAEARAIKDPKLQDMTLSRIDDEATRKRTIEQQKTDQTVQGAIDAIDQGGGLADIPAASLIKMSPSDRGFLEDYERRKKSNQFMTDSEQLVFYDQLIQNTRRDPKYILGMSLAELKLRTPQDRWDDIIKMRGDAAAPQKPETSILDATAEQKNKYIDGLAAELGLAATGKQNTPEKKSRRAMLRRRVEEGVEAFKKANNREPSYSELTTIGDQLTEAVVFDKGFWSEEQKKYTFELTGEEDLSAVVVPDADKDRILKRIQQLRPGMAVSDDQLRSIYLQERSQ